MMALTKSGELLREARQKMGLSLSDVEREIKIRGKFLEALENADFDVFHSLVYARGFLKNYSEFLGLDSKLILTLFKRETTAQDIKVLPQGMLEGSSLFRITPRRVSLFTALIIVLAILYYLFQEYRGFLGAPSLSINAPNEGAVVREEAIEVKGKADSDATVFINGEPVALLQDGQFVKTIQVFKGEVTVTAVAKNRRGKETTIIRRIKVE